MIKFRKFSLEAYDKNRHYVLAKNLENDKMVQKYVSKRFVSWLDKMPEGNQGFEVDSPYVIVRDNNFVGILGTLDMSHDGVIDLWCAIDKSERNKGHADAILGEMTPYLIEEGFSNIRLRINKNNIFSNKTAVGNGYILDRDDSSKDNVYYYFENSGKSR